MTTALIQNISKAFGMPATDGTHTYVFKSGEYGSLYQYWWMDQAGNYYRYSNAPPESPDYDPFYGEPMMDPEQPVPEKHTKFFTKDGYKRNMAVPEGIEPLQNPSYDKNSAVNIWFEVFDLEGPKYVYLDSDVKENADLYVQSFLRTVDSNLGKLRQFATESFAAPHTKDKITGCIIMLCDQAFYEVEELSNALVGDVEFIDQSVLLLGRRFVCDLPFLDFLTSITAGRSPTDPLFMYDTKHGSSRVGVNYINSVFFTARVSPKFLLYWNASHLYSRIVNRMSFQKVPAEDVETLAFEELARVLSSHDDVQYLVDYKLRTTLARNYQATGDVPDAAVAKSLSRLVVDDFGIAVVRSDLTSFREDEQEFSNWLHNEPMHDSTPETEAAIESVLPETEIIEPPPEEIDEEEGTPKKEPTEKEPTEKKEEPSNA